MSNTKEILDRINGVKDTRKITNAMYLIAASKLRKARNDWEQVTDYFETIQGTINTILDNMPDVEHKYLEAINSEPKETNRAYILITADKGLAGSYNFNGLRKIEQELSRYPKAKLFVVGQIGRHYFMKKKLNFQAGFLYSSESPSLQRARNITVEVLDQYLNGEFQDVYIVYTKMKNALQSEATLLKLLPLSRKVRNQSERYQVNGQEAFYPDIESVLDQVAPIAMHGRIFGALSESYFAELNDRMVAMSSASKSADEIIESLQLQYNRMRQTSITQEITEIVAGSKAQKKKR